MDRKLKAAFLTLGCKVNFYETEKLKKQFEDAGHIIVGFEEEAHVYIINTCTVTNIADRKSRKMIHRARRKNPDALVIATGCYVDSAKGKEGFDDSIDLYISNAEKDHLLSLVMEAAKDIPERVLSDGTGRSVKTHTRAYVKVQNGCNQYCSYCIIPYVRGPLSSRKEEDVVAEVEDLAAQGFLEVVLTGIHLSSYGIDLMGEKNFIRLQGKPLLRLVKKIAEIPGIRRVRLGSLEPRIITADFVQELSKIEKVCPHFHLSLQSGSDGVLKRMNRHYTTREYADGVDILRKYYHAPAITTDIIVGFPGETEKEFEETICFVEKTGFSKIHVFKYSRRKGTMADAMEGQVPEQVKSTRSDRLIKAGIRTEQNYQKQFLGKTEQVLYEEVAERNGSKYILGYNERYVRIAVPVDDATGDDKTNTIENVLLSGRLDEEILKGQLL